MISLWSGDKDIGKFGDDIGRLGRGLAEFSSYMSGEGVFDPDMLDKINEIDDKAGISRTLKYTSTAFEAGIEAIKKIVAIKFPETDNGLLGILGIGSSDADKFAGTMGDLGKGLRDLEFNTRSIKDWTVLNKAIIAISDLASGTTFVIPEGSKLDSLSGWMVNNLTTLGTGLAGMYDALKDIELSEFESTGHDSSPFVKRVTVAASVFKQLVNAMAPLAGIEVVNGSMLEDKDAIESFGELAGSVGTALKSAYDSLSIAFIPDPNSAKPQDYEKSLLQEFADPNSPILTAMKNSVTVVSDIADVLANARLLNPEIVKKFADSFNNLATTSIGNFVNELGKETSISSMYDAIDGLVDNVTTKMLNPNAGILSPLNTIKDSFGKLGRQGYNSLDILIDGTYKESEGIGLVVTKINKQLNDLRLRKSDQSFVRRFGEMGYASADEFMASLSSRLVAYVTGNNLPDGSPDYNAGIIDVGRNFLRGFIKGVSDPNIIQEAVDALEELGTITIDTLMICYDEHSPSKVTEKIGKFFSQGLINGILSKSDLLKGAVEKLAGDGSDGISSAVSKVLDLINNGVDSDVTITPILNLDEVTSGIGDLNGMLDGATGQIDMNGFINSASLDTLSGFDVNGLDYNINEYLYNQNGADVVGSGDTIVNYTQNNYSPKSLSNLDIYRNTKTQLSSLKKGLALNA